MPVFAKILPKAAERCYNTLLSVLTNIDTFRCLFLLSLLMLLSYMYFFDYLSYVFLNPTDRPNFEDKKGKKG